MMVVVATRVESYAYGTRGVFHRGEVRVWMRRKADAQSESAPLVMAEHLSMRVPWHDRWPAEVLD